MRGASRISFRLKSVSVITSRYAIALLMLSPTVLKAQRQTIYTNGVWLCHFGNIHLNNRLTIVSETELHLKQWVQRWNEQVLDLGLSDKLTDKWRVGAGLGLYRGAQYFDEFFFKNEWRGWQEVNYTLKGKWVFWQRMRVEERWIQGVKNGQKMNSYDYVTRMRYRTELQKPLRGGRVAPVIGNEFMASPGYWNSNRFLDQNRTWVGVNLKVSRTVALQTQYMKIFQWRANNTLEDQNIFRVNIVQHFNQKG
ncbi:DUF2490 domain-containing protein [Flavisolibacter ginsenosidimutans]|uniref:DUF2490 domain-containing protein n=1 Tax=Flavisolibacter ginsenosidimutans TaxID=661481 RepID=A0A5B8UHA2_9BACT|nr:DUF2490 domain-containing protein [Flavisolibacter ginsenosidimutans]QEC55893.1 DUF2490 domain-containing protein [Flavisolibacter ginsenosidimutans]